MEVVSDVMITIGVWIILDAIWDFAFPRTK